MDENDKHDIAERIISAFRDEFAALALPQEMHKEHHVFIQKWIDKQSKSEDRWEKVKTNVIGALIIGTVTSVLTGAYHAANYIRDHLR